MNSGHAYFRQRDISPYAGFFRHRGARPGWTKRSIEVFLLNADLRYKDGLKRRQCKGGDDNKPNVLLFEILMSHSPVGSHFSAKVRRPRWRWVDPTRSKGRMVLEIMHVPVAEWQLE
jgi:hypothetical protein